MSKWTATICEFIGAAIIGACFTLKGKWSGDYDIALLAVQSVATGFVGWSGVMLGYAVEREIRERKR